MFFGCFSPYRLRFCLMMFDRLETVVLILRYIMSYQVYELKAVFFSAVSSVPEAQSSFGCMWQSHLRPKEKDPSPDGSTFEVAR